MDIPEQYRGVVFSSSLIKTDMPYEYGEYLTKLHDEISLCNWKFKNELICSPPGHSKTIFAYSCIQNLFRKNVSVFPLKSVDELSAFEDDYQKVEYMFVRVPMTADVNTFKKMANLLDIRVRAGKVTIFLYNGSYEQLTFTDNFGILKSLIGDGTFGTLHNSTWKRRSSL